MTIRKVILLNLSSDDLSHKFCNRGVHPVYQLRDIVLRHQKQLIKAWCRLEQMAVYVDDMDCGTAHASMHV